MKTTELTLEQELTAKWEQILNKGTVISWSEFLDRKLKSAVKAKDYVLAAQIQELLTKDV